MRKRGSAIAYVSSSLVFSSASLFSKPISQDRPYSGIGGGDGTLPFDSVRGAGGVEEVGIDEDDTPFAEFANVDAL